VSGDHDHGFVDEHPLEEVTWLPTRTDPHFCWDPRRFSRVAESIADVLQVVATCVELSAVGYQMRDGEHDGAAHAAGDLCGRSEAYRCISLVIGDHVHLIGRARSLPAIAPEIHESTVGNTGQKGTEEDLKNF
jgi:hypothetical protein